MNEQMNSAMDEITPRKTCRLNNVSYSKLIKFMILIFQAVKSKTKFFLLLKVSILSVFLSFPLINSFQCEIKES